MSEILLRNDGTLTDVDRKLRIIEMIAVPWDQPAEVFWRGDIWTEMFKRGAFDGIEARTDKIMANHEHVKGKTVGRLVGFDPAHKDGLFVQLQVRKGPKGDDVLDLAEDDMIFPSVGYRAQKPTDVRLDKQARHRDVLNAWLDHLGMVEDPAYKGARVLAVRGEPSEFIDVDDGPLPPTPLLDEYAADPILSWARDRLTS